MGEAARVTGGCTCGAIRFAVDRAGVVSAHHCHCADCRRATGSGFATFCAVPAAAFAIEAGTPKSWQVKGTSGGSVKRSFCGDCGSQLYSEVSIMPGFYFVKAGVLDDASWVEPVSSFWGSSAQPWARPNPAIPVHDRNPT